MKRSPWYFVPALYFQQGVPVFLVQQFSVILYKRLGIPNDQIGLWTSLIAWPWILKMLWSPLVDASFTKRAWVFATQWGVGLALACVAFGLRVDHFLSITLGLFFVAAMFSATSDVALDGYYLLALRKDQQAFFMGITSTFFRLAMILCNGFLVILAGVWEKNGVSVAESWQRVILVGVAIYLSLTIYGMTIAPKLDRDIAVHQERPLEAFQTFFTQKKAWAIIAFTLFYRFGESMLTKMSAPFLLDSREVGGLGLNTIQTGAVLGNVGVLALVAGGILGGILVSKRGLRQCLLPMAILMNLPNLLYVWAAHAQPGIAAVYGITAVEQFTYGFGMAPYMVFTMYVAQRSKFQTSHYAIITALMAFGAMGAGIASGFLQKNLGYFGFYCVVCLATIPGMVLLKAIPLEASER